MQQMIVITERTKWEDYCSGN